MLPMSGYLIFILRDLTGAKANKQGKLDQILVSKLSMDFPLTKPEMFY